MRPVEFGLGLQGDKPLEQYRRLARIAESHGFDVLSVFGDLFYMPPLPPLLAMAEVTERVRLGPACLNPYSMHPYEIAGQIAVLDAASGGRAYLGLARGSWLDQFAIAQHAPARTLREAVAVVRRLWEKDPTGFDGRVYHLQPDRTLNYDVLRSDIPVLIGGWGPRILALAGEIADAVKIGGSANPAMVEVARDRIREGTRRRGRQDDDVQIVLGAVTVVDEDGDAARQKAREEVALYLAVVADLDPTVRIPGALMEQIRNDVDAGRFAEAGRLIPDEYLDLFAFSGTPAQVAAQAAALIDAGVSRVEFGTPHGLTPEHGVELLGSAVLPLLRGAVTAEP